VRGTYNESSSSLRRARVALASHNASLFKIVAAGDSTVLGANANGPQSTDSWPSQLSKLLAAQEAKQASTGVVYFLNYAIGVDPRIELNGVWALANVGPFNNAGKQSNTSGSEIVFTPTIPVDSFTIYYVKATDTGSFSYKVDAGSATTINSTAASTTYSTVVVPAGAAGTHSLTITSLDANYTRIIGVEGTNGTTGTVVTRAGLGGAMASSFTVGSSIGLAGSIGTFDALTPNLVILGFGVNEYLQQIPIATYKTNMQTIIDRAKTAGADVVMLTGVPNNDTSKAISQVQYRQAQYDLADTNDLAVIDIDYLWGSYATSNASPLALYGDVTHPNTKGYRDIAANVYALITSGGRLSSAVTAAASPTIYAADTYSGTNGALTTTETGAKTYTQYSTAGGTWSRANGRLVADKLAVATSPMLGVNTGSADGTVQLRFNTVSNSGMMFRFQDVSNYWMIGVNAGVYKLYKNVAGTFTVVGTSAVVPAAGDLVSVVLSGSSITGKINGVAVAALTTSDTFLQSATIQGAWVGGSAAQTALFDNFDHRA
jgi:lysophospholipase L1-like esterase